MEFAWRRFGDIDPGTLYAILQLRADVFVLEQQSLYRDLDGRDQAAHHLIISDDGTLCGYLRVEGPGMSREDAVIGRVVFPPEARGKGLGRQAMREALAHIGREWGAAPVVLGAQCAQQGFYESLGFEVISETYDDGGIDHVDMRFST